MTSLSASARKHPWLAVVTTVLLALALWSLVRLFIAIFEAVLVPAGVSSPIWLNIIIFVIAISLAVLFGGSSLREILLKISRR